MESKSPRLLSLDPGKHCGFSYIDVTQPVPGGLKALRHQSGLWTLEIGRFQSQGMRFIQLKKCLMDASPDFIVYEQVNFPHKSTAAAQMYWGCVTTIQLFCEEQGIEYATVLTHDLKRRAAGKGNSRKPEIIRAANTFFSIDPPLNDEDKSTNHDSDIADAMWLCQIGIETYGNFMTFRKQGKTTSLNVTVVVTPTDTVTEIVQASEPVQPSKPVDTPEYPFFRENFDDTEW
jgi:Holliday junction resolvasome RuvABC endonuclease subunit